MAAPDRFVLPSPLQGTVVTVTVDPGDLVKASQPLVVIESMKMEHVVASETAGIVVEVLARVGETVTPGAPLIRLDPSGQAADDEAMIDAVDLDRGTS